MFTDHLDPFCKQFLSNCSLRKIYFTYCYNKEDADSLKAANGSR